MRCMLLDRFDRVPDEALGLLLPTICLGSTLCDSWC
jgi:hypothetical protein